MLKVLPEFLEFLLKIWEVVGFLFAGNGETRRKRAADAFDSVRLLLSRHFVPKHLGVNYLSRNEARAHNTSFTVEFFGDNVTLIWDGTYIYTGKSSAHAINRATYYWPKASSSSEVYVAGTPWWLCAGHYRSVSRHHEWCKHRSKYFAHMRLTYTIGVKKMTLCS